MSETNNVIVIADKQDIVNIANAIRANSDITDELSLSGIARSVNYVAEYVAANTNNGIDTSDATAEQSDIFINKTAYVDGEKITGTFTIDNELNTQDGLITEIVASLRNKMTGGVDIDEELSVQDDLIAQIQAALNNKINSIKKEAK